MSIGVTTERITQERASPEIAEKTAILSMFLPENAEFNPRHPCAGARVTAFKSSKLIGRGLQEVSTLATVIGSVRSGAVIQNIFDPAFRLAEGDTVLVLGDPANLETLESEAGAR